MMRVDRPSLDHIGVYVCWGSDKHGSYCRGSYQGRHMLTYVSEPFADDPECRKYVEEKTCHKLVAVSRLEPLEEEVSCQPDDEDDQRTASDRMLRVQRPPHE